MLYTLPTSAEIIALYMKIFLDMLDMAHATTKTDNADFK